MAGDGVARNKEITTISAVYFGLLVGFLLSWMFWTSLEPILEAYVKRFLTEGEFYHPAGYFPDQGCFDTGYNGLTMYFAT